MVISISLQTIKFNKSKPLLIVFILMIFSQSSFGQSTDRSSPTPLTSRTISGDITAGDKKEYFYTFTAGPGKFYVTLETETSGNQSGLYAHFSSSASRGDFVFSSAIHNGSHQAKKEFNVSSKRKITMKLQGDSVADGIFKITLSGAVSLPK